MEDWKGVTRKIFSSSSVSFEVSGGSSTFLLRSVSSSSLVEVKLIGGT
jgi:hypothetical protein